MKNLILLSILFLTPTLQAASFSTRTPNVIQVSLHHGYLDNRPISDYVGGKLVQEWTAYLLSLDCQNNPLKYLCDYQIDFSTDNQFEMSKEFITSRGKVKVIIKDMSPNISEDDDLNRTTYKARQLEQSAKAKAFFLQAASTSDVMLYMGHSRYGGGPDFGVGVLDSHQDHDIDYYQSGKFTGFKDLVTAFAKAPKLPAYFGLLSCSSGPHFGNQLKKSFPTVNYIFTSDVQTQNAEQGARKAFEVLHKILEQNLN